MTFTSNCKTLTRTLLMHKSCHSCTMLQLIKPTLSCKNKCQSMIIQENTIVSSTRIADLTSRLLIQLSTSEQQVVNGEQSLASLNIISPAYCYGDFEQYKAKKVMQKVVNKINRLPKMPCIGDLHRYMSITIFCFFMISSLVLDKSPCQQSPLRTGLVIEPNAFQKQFYSKGNNNAYLQYSFMLPSLSPIHVLD